jgi:hypothetical protein
MEMKMRTYGFDFGHRDDGKIFEFKSRRHAASHGNGLMVATIAEDLVKSSVTTQQMVTLYNRIFGGSPVKSFPDKITAARALIALAQARSIYVAQTEGTEPMNDVAEVKAEKPKKAKAEKVVKVAKEKVVKAPGNGRKGRNSMFDGRTFKVADGLAENPRRSGSKGFDSFEILMQYPEGITYEAYLAVGGRRQDLVWDLMRDRVVAV